MCASKLLNVQYQEKIHSVNNIKITSNMSKDLPTKFLLMRVILQYVKGPPHLVVLGDAPLILDVVTPSRLKTCLHTFPKHPIFTLTA